IDLTHANRSPTTVRAYRSDLAAFARQFSGPPEHITAEVLRDYFATLTHLAPATRARRRPSLASFVRWPSRRDLLPATPMDRRDLTATGYPHGPIFRAEKNGVGGPLRYSTVQEHWARYTAAAGVSATLHQLRHSHATELVNGGVSLPTIRKRLGHKNIQTTLRYAEQADAVADAEMRKWRRERKRGQSS